MAQIKVLILGCGSIGRRHARNAFKLGAEVVLCDVDLERASALSAELGGAAIYTDYVEAAAKSGATAAVIATPSDLHVAPAQVILDAGIHVLMEKPLCTSLTEAMDLQVKVRTAHTVFMMAHTYRFRSEWREVKRIVDSTPLGKVYSAEFAGGWYLPDWHVREDYRHEFAAQKKLGGGVMLTSLSHLFDIVIWFFGDIEQQSGAKMRLGELEMDADNAATCVIKTKSGISVTLIEDFLSRRPRRSFRLNAEHGYLEADFNLKQLRVWDARKKRVHPDAASSKKASVDYFRILEDGVMYDLQEDVFAMEYSGNDAYLAEMEFFFDAVRRRTSPSDMGIEAGVMVLRALQNEGVQDWTLPDVGKDRLWRQ